MRPWQIMLFIRYVWEPAHRLWHFSLCVLSSAGWKMFFQFKWVSTLLPYSDLFCLNFGSFVLYLLKMEWKFSLTSQIPSHISDSGKFFDCGIINFAIKFLQLSGKLVKKRNLSYYGMSIIYMYLCIFYWSQRSRFSQTRELIKSWPLAVFVWWVALWFLCISF